jgi:hypothetical protein
MRTKIIIIFFLQFIFVSIFNAQVTQEWVSRYNGPGGMDDGAYLIAVDGLGNVYVTGSSMGSGTGYDYVTIKYNVVGVEQWVSRYNGPEYGDDIAQSIAVDGLGNVYVTGKSLGSGTGDDYATIKYNSSGFEEWVARYNGPGYSTDHAWSIAVDGSGNGDDEGRSIAVDGSGNVYVTGSSLGSGTDDDYATIKYNSSGVEQWVSRYNGPGNGGDEKPSLALDDSGNVYVTGSSLGSGTDDDYATIKYDSSGVEQWVSRYNGPADSTDKARRIAVDGSGNVYVTGSSLGSGTDYDCATIKYNSSGVEQWVQRYSEAGSWSDSANAIALDNSGNVYVAGNGTDSNYTTIKYNSAGIEQWVVVYNGPGNGLDGATSIAVDGSGNVYVTGFSMGSGTDYDCATIKYNSTGVEKWVARYNGSGNSADYAWSIAVDGLGNVYVTGQSVGSGTGFDYITIKYSQPPAGVYQTTSDMPENYSLSQNYPNPFNPSTSISFSIGTYSYTSLRVYDVLGQEVAIIFSGEMSAGSYTKQWNANGMPSGIYFYRLSVVPSARRDLVPTDSRNGQAGLFTETKKLVLLR